MKKYDNGSLSMLALVFLIYGLIFYLQFTHQLKMDFSSFYSTAKALQQNDNPYQCLFLMELGKKLPANLNPPIFLLIFESLSTLSYNLAIPVWALISLIAGLYGAIIIARLAFTQTFLQKYWPRLLFIYMALFTTIMDTAIGQMGAVLLFFVMCGYHCYLQRRYKMAGILWGIIAAIKLFPALLFLQALAQKRYQVCLLMVLTICCLWLLPLFIYGTTLYQQYFDMLPRVLWYGDNWNASIYGFIFRLFVDTTNHQPDLTLPRIAFIALFLMLSGWYFMQIAIHYQDKTNHRPFCLSLIMMLLLSPFGWLYYFSLLLFPLALTWQQINTHQSVSPLKTGLWYLAFFIINLPLDYVMSTKMPDLINNAHPAVPVDALLFAQDTIAYAPSHSPRNNWYKRRSIGRRNWPSCSIAYVAEIRHHHQDQ